MSPEQASGAPLDGRSDLFAMGVILYEMITGKKAFDAESLPTLIMQIVQKDPLPIRQISADSPVGLQKIVNKLLQKKPDKRFQSGHELHDALEREWLALKDEDEEKRGYLPLQVKWTAIMGSVVALAMAVSSILVFQAQRNVLTQQAIDAGISLSKFVAVQAAIPVLGEDWITLDSFVQDAAARDSFRYLIVSDHTGVVRSASDPALVGSNWQAEGIEDILYDQDEVQVTDLGEVYNFSLPVLFNEIVVGGVNMGLDTSELDSVLDTTRRMMMVLGLAIVLAVSLVLYIFNKLIAKNVVLATRALRLFGQGRLETRISKKRSDEFGDLFDSFNNMADSLENKVEYSSADDNGAPGSSPESRVQNDLDVSGITQGMVEDKTIVRQRDDDKK
jgi:serine/threonine-protein kinase